MQAYAGWPRLTSTKASLLINLFQAAKLFLVEGAASYLQLVLHDDGVQSA